MKKRVVSIILCLCMLLSVIPANVFAENVFLEIGDDFIEDDVTEDTVTVGNVKEDTVTKDIAPLLTGVEIFGLEKDEDGFYHVSAGQRYYITLVFYENDELQMDMSDDIQFELPAGVVANDMSGTIEIGVNDVDLYTPIFHNWTISDNTVTITWNQEDEAFADLLRSPVVHISFSLHGIFDGSEEEIVFEDGTKVIVEVDELGSITINHTVTGLKPDFTLTDEQKEAMTFELRNAKGQAVKTFTYADMESGSIIYSKMTAGEYTVVETGHPTLSGYTFDADDSTTTDSGTLPTGGVLTLSLLNDYDFDKGDLELNKIIDCTNLDNLVLIPDSIKDNISFTITGPYDYSKTVTFNDFVGGKYLLTDLDVGEYTITETNSVTEYSCTYKVNNAAVDTPVATAAVVKGETASVTFENIYSQILGNLTVKKTASGAAVPEDTEFTVTFPDGTTTRTFKYSDMTDGEYTLTDIPLGTYHVTENKDSAQVDGYVLTVTGEGDVVLSENETKEIHNEYVLGGKLKINKTISGDLTSDDLTDAQKKAMKFTVKDASDAVVGVLTYADVLNDKTLSLPAGTYTVTESGAVISGYSVETLPADGVVTVSVSVGETAQASFTNTYTIYSFTLVKRFAEGSLYNQENLPDLILDVTYIIVKDIDTEESIFRKTLREFLEKPDGWTIKGHTNCIVGETNEWLEVIPNGSCHIRMSADGGNTFIDSREPDKYMFYYDFSLIGLIDVIEPKDTTVIIENKYESGMGRIAVDKEVIGLSDYEESLLRDRITFSIYRENGEVFSLYEENIPLEEMEAGMIVPLGNYYVQETGSIGVNGYSTPEVQTRVESCCYVLEIDPTTGETIGYHVTTPEFSELKDGSNSDVFTLTAGDTESIPFTTVHFTNTYHIGVGAGKVALSKYVRGLDEIGSLDEVKLTRDLEVNNTEDQLLYDGIQFELEIKVDNAWHHYDTYALSEFVNGVSLLPGHYRMTELYGDVEGYALHTDYLFISEHTEGTEQSFNGSVEFDITKLQSLDLEAHNVYTKVGNLKITKKIAGDVTELSSGVEELVQELKKIEINVTGPFGFNEIFYYNVIFLSGEKVFTNIPVGEYTITEMADDTSGFVLTVESNLTGENAPKSGTVTVSAGETTTVNFTNTYTTKTGTLKIHKTFDGEVPETLTEEQKKAMTFIVYRVGSGGVTYTEKYRVTYDQFDNDGFYTFENVPVGSYSVSEIIGNVLTDEYRVDITGDISSAIVSYGETTTFEIKNTFTKTGSLKLVKVFEGDTISQDDMDNVEFTYWRVGEGGEIIGKEFVTYEYFTDGCYEVKGLIPGNYVVKEEDGNTNYIHTATVQINEGTAVTGTSTDMVITAGICTTVTFTNTYTKYPSLQILKVNEGALTHLSTEQAKAIIFTVFDSEGDVFASRDWYYLGGRSFSKMEPGEYTVTETISDPDGSLFGDYSIATRYKIDTGEDQNGRTAHITLSSGKTVVTFTNTYIKPLKAVLSSSRTYVGMATEDGVKYPVWQFKLAISNMVPLSTTDGTAVFDDVFDTTRENNLFRLATKGEVAEAVGSGEQNAYITSQVEGKAAPTAVFDEENNAIVVSNVTADTADKCIYTYYLIVKDRDALNTINTPTTENSAGVELDFNNKITYHPMPNSDETEDTEAAYEYSFTAISKDIANLDEQGFLYQTVGDLKIYADHAIYSVTLNEDGMTLGDEETITATDIFSENQIIVPDSITTDPSTGVSYTLNNDEHKIIFTIPNSTPVTISYRANIANVVNPVVQLTNSIDLLGFAKGVDETVECFISGEGEGDVYSVIIKKVDSLDDSIVLEGVKFGLYDGSTDELLTNGTTDASGQVQFKYWGTAGALRPDHTYYVKEESTISGYHLNSEKIYFRITDATPGMDGNVVLLSSGNTLTVPNTPVTASLEVTKAFSDWTKQGEFSFKLEAVDGAPMPEDGEDVAVATEAEPTASFGLIRFPVTDEDFADDQVVTYSYTIQELEGEAAGVTYDTTKYPVTVVISDHNSDGIKEISIIYNEKESLTVTNYYGEGKLTVSKTLEGNNTDPDKEFSFTISLDPALNGTYSGVTFTDGVATIKLKGGESKTIENLPNGTEYTVTEDDYTADGYELTFKSGDTGTITEGTVSTASFINTRNTYGKLTVSKTIAGNAADPNKEFSFTITLEDTTINGTYSGVEFTDGVATIKLKGGESKTIEGLPNDTEYTVTEEDYTSAGYELTSKSGDTGTITEGTVSTASFTNTRNAYGKLTVSKTIAGNAADPNKEFTFTIELDPAISGTYSGVTFTDGVATITLKGGESKTIEGLPNGTEYTVTEDDYSDDGYELTSKSGDTGTITEGTVSTASFTNTRNAYGNLTISKKLKGENADSNKEFKFTIKLDPAISGTYSGVTFTDGVATIKLKGGESKTIKNLPNGTKYTVTEEDYTSDGYELTSKSGDTGTITENVTAEATFTNTYNDNSYGNLTISKKLKGENADYYKKFKFTIKLDPAISGTYNGVTFTDGVATITLKGGESKTIKNLPSGTKYTVTEKDYSDEGYELTDKSGDTGTIIEDETAAAVFTNTSHITVPQTGNDSNLPLCFTILFASVAGMIGTMISGRKKKYYID